MKADTKLIDSNINMCGLVIAYMCGGGQKKAWNVVNRVEEDGLRGMERELVANGVVHGGRWKAWGYRLPKLFFESLISCVDHGKLPWICYFKWIGTEPKWNKWTCSISHLCMSVSPIHFYTLARYVVPWFQSILSSHCTWICVVNEHGRANEHACCVCVCGVYFQSIPKARLIEMFSTFADINTHSPQNGQSIGWLWRCLCAKNIEIQPIISLLN